MPTLWPHIPNEIVEIIRFQSDIKTCRTGEFRDGLRLATTELNYGCQLSDAEAARAAGLFRSDPSQEWYVPLYTEMTFLAADVTALDTTVTVDADADWIVGGQAAIVETDQKAEVLTINDLTGSTLEFTTGVVDSYDGDAVNPLIVAPVRTCLATTALGQNLRIGITGVSMRFTSVEPNDIQENPYTLLGDYGVFSDDRVVAGSAQGFLGQTFDLINEGFGDYHLEDVENYSRYRTVLNVVLKTQAQRHDFRKWLHFVLGKTEPFWLPTWKNDLAIQASALAASSVIRVADTTPVPNDLTRLGVAISFGSTVLYRSIDSVVDGGTYHDLTLNTTHGVDIPDTATVSLMHLVRFDTDTFQFNHNFTKNGYISFVNCPVIEVDE